MREGKESVGQILLGVNSLLSKRSKTFGQQNKLQKKNM